MGIVWTLILLLLFLVAPSSLHGSRTSFGLVICLISLAYVCVLFIHPYLFSDAGEPQLSFHPCRLVVYLSTFAKPISLYGTALFGWERIFTQILGRCFWKTNATRKLFERVFSLSIVIGSITILSVKLYETLLLVPKNNVPSAGKSEVNPNVRGIDSNDTVFNFTFQYCFRSISASSYGRILSFALIQSWLDYILLGMIILSTSILMVDQFYLMRFHSNPSSKWNVNTQLFFILASCVILFEVILLRSHSIIADVANENSDTQVNNLQIMLMTYSIRSIYLPLITCLTQCHRLRELINEFLFFRPYLEQIDETDR